MDPNACFSQMLRYGATMAWDDAYESWRALDTWMRMGGFGPDVEGFSPERWDELGKQYKKALEATQ